MPAPLPPRAGPATVSFPAVRSYGGRSEAREALPLPSRRLEIRRVEIRRVEPALERAAQRRPVAVDHREPRRVAVVPARQRRLPEQPLILKAEAQRRGAARHVQRVALPL